MHDRLICPTSPHLEPRSHLEKVIPFVPWTAPLVAFRSPSLKPFFSPWAAYPTPSHRMLTGVINSITQLPPKAFLAWTNMLQADLRSILYVVLHPQGGGVARATAEGHRRGREWGGRRSVEGVDKFARAEGRGAGSYANVCLSAIADDHKHLEKVFVLMI